MQDPAGIVPIQTPHVRPVIYFLEFREQVGTPDIGPDRKADDQRCPTQRRTDSKGKTPQRTCVGLSPGPGQWLPRTSTIVMPVSPVLAR